MSLSTTYPFTTPGNYSFDSDSLEVSGGLAALRNRHDEEAYCSFTTKDLDRAAGGSTSGTLNGVAAISSGTLDITGGTGSWDIDGTGKVGADPNIVTIRFKYTPQYSGIPASHQRLYIEQQSSSVNSNQILIQHSTGSGNLQVSFRNSAGAAQGTLTAITTWSPTSGTTYEIELNVNTTTGTQKLYLDGVQQGSDHGATYTRSSTIGFMSIGNASVNQNFVVDDFQRFDYLKHTANFASEVPRTIPATAYDTANPVLQPNTSVVLDSLDSFTTSETIAGSDNIKYILRFSGQDTYHDGVEWVNSDGTYAQSNTASEISTNIGDLDLTTGGSLIVKILFHSDTGATTPSLDSLQLDYSFYNTGTEPNKCILYGEVLDNCCQPVVGATVTVDGDDYFYDTALISRGCETTTDSEGKWEMEVVETDTDSTTVDVTIEYKQLSGRNKKVTYENLTIPNTATCALSDLVP